MFHAHTSCFLHIYSVFCLVLLGIFVDITLLIGHNNILIPTTSRCTAVSVVTTLWAGQPRNCGLISSGEAYFPRLQSIQTSSRPHPSPMQCVLGHYPQGKVLTHDTDHSSSFICAEVNGKWSQLLIPPFAFMACRRPTSLLHLPLACSPVTDRFLLLWTNLKRQITCVFH